jgi:hypothetical protein
MNILKEYKGYQLLERDNNYFVRFWDGREKGTPCEIRITEADAKQAFDTPAVIRNIVSNIKDKPVLMEDNLYKEEIMYYLVQRLELSKAWAQEIYERLAYYPDIYEEFYKFIQTGMYPQNGIVVEGYTAKYLAANYPLTGIGVYNYLIYLREKPAEALSDLRAGLPRQ